MQNLKLLREQIEKIDTTIIEKLAERQKISKKIGELKKQFGKNIIDEARETELRSYYENLSLELDLDPGFTKRLFKLIMDYSKKIQAL